MPETHSPIAQEMLGLARVRIEHPVVNEQNLKIAAFFDQDSLDQDHMKNPDTNTADIMDGAGQEDWVSGKKGPLWWMKTEQEPDPIGFVFAYRDEHVSDVRSALESSQLSISFSGRIKELSSFVAGDGKEAEEMDAIVQAASELFKKDETDVITMYVTHDEETGLLDSAEAERMQHVGFKPVFSLRYAEDDEVDSTCFVIDRSSLAAGLQRRATKT